jgi:phosphonate transport system permease protein
MNDLETLRRRRPRSTFVRGSVAALAALALYSWLSGDIQPGALLQADGMHKLERFVGEELVPHSLRGRPFDMGEGWAWFSGILSDRGLSGLAATLAISVLAAVLAGLGALLLCLPAARNFMTPDPFLFSAAPGRGRRLVFAAVVHFTRFLQLFLRSIPEYVWAFLLLAMIGPSAWPAIIALAIHNSGILGKLYSESVENLDPQALRSLRALGAGRAQIAGAAIFPLALPRFLLYFFYRFETCVREATVLGMLGTVSLGYWIADARMKRFYDEMFALVVLGAVIVLFGDLVSSVARRVVRRA